MKQFIILFLLVFFSQNSFSQKNEISIGLMDVSVINKARKIFSSNSLNYDERSVLSSTREYIVERLLEDNRIIIVERSRLNLVKKELELQKSESFMDGYVVGQGKQIGADYLLFAEYNPDEKEMTLSLFEIANDLVKNKKIVNLSKNFWGESAHKENVQFAVSQMLDEAFPMQIPLIEILKGNSEKASVVLVAGGSKNGFSLGDKLNFYIKTFAVVGRDTLSREKTIAEGKISEVENEHFSKVKMGKGKKEIMIHYNKGDQVLCKLKGL